MTLDEIVQRLGLERCTPELQSRETVDVTAGYVSDLLSDVLANAPAGGVLVTIQVHMNVVAVALHAELSAVVFASGRVPPDEVKARAAAEGIHLYTSAESAFDLAGKLYSMGIRGPRR